MKATSRRRERGFTLMEALVVLALLGMALAFIALVVRPLMAGTKAGEFEKELLAIEQGLATYYKSNYRFPRGTGWAWNAGGAYVDTILQQKGWQYSCSGTTITITTPAIQDAGTRTKVRDAFARKCNSATISGSSVQCILNDKPCP